MGGNLVVKLTTQLYVYIPSTLEVDTNVYNNYLSSQGRVKILLLFCKSSVHIDDNYACSVICCYLITHPQASFT